MLDLVVSCYHLPADRGRCLFCRFFFLTAAQLVRNRRQRALARVSDRSIDQNVENFNSCGFRSLMGAPVHCLFAVCDSVI